MGALCSGNIFNELQDKHGAEFVKLMVAENSKDLVQTHFEGLYNSSDAMFKNVHGNINGQYEHQLTSLEQKYSGIKSKISSIPGGIEGL